MGNTYKIKSIIPVVVLVLIVPFVMRAQESSLMNQGVENKIARAEKKISKANFIVNKSEKYAGKIEEAEAEGARRKLRRYKTKSNRIVITSASYFKEGYAKKYKTYKKVVSKGLKGGELGSDAFSLVDEAKIDYKQGRKHRRKSANEKDVNEGVEYLLQANKEEESAIEKLKKAAGMVQPMEVEQEQPVLVASVDSVIEQPDTIAATEDVPVVFETAPDSVSTPGPVLLASITDTLSVREDSMGIAQTDDMVAPETESPISPVEAVEEIENEEKETKGVENLYFSVQFLAEKQPVPKEKISTLYDGPFELVKHEVDGWYKYAFGRFKTFEEANEMKTRAGVEGFVVAYLNEERISTRRAVQMFE